MRISDFGSELSKIKRFFSQRIKIRISASLGFVLNVEGRELPDLKIKVDVQSWLYGQLRGLEVLVEWKIGPKSCAKTTFFRCP